MCTGPHEIQACFELNAPSRVLKNYFSPLLVPDHGRSGEIMHSLMCLISGAQRKPRPVSFVRLGQATLKKSMDELFQHRACREVRF
jgi:hypothetical protein